MYVFLKYGLLLGGIDESYINIRKYSFCLLYKFVCIVEL